MSRLVTRWIGWPGIAACVVLAHLAAPVGAAETATWSLVLLPLLGLAVLTAVGAGRTGGAAVLAALLLAAALWSRPNPLELAAIPDVDRPRPRTLPPVQIMAITGAARLTGAGSAVPARWTASCLPRSERPPRCHGRDVAVELHLPVDVPPPPPGSVVRAHAFVHPPTTPRNPGFDALHQRARQLGVAGAVRVRDPSSWTVAQRGDASAGYRLALWRLRLRERLKATMPAPAAALTCGLALGDRSAIAPALAETLRLTGTSHILAVSGTHVGVVVGGVAWLLAALVGRTWPDLWRRLPRPTALALPLIGVAWGYVYVAGAPASACRAATMATVVLLWRAALLPSALAPALGLALVALVAVDPWALADVGLGLSLLGVIGAAWGGGAVGAMVPAQRRAWRSIAALAGASIGASAATAPIALPTFGVWPLAAPVANLVVVPLVSLLLLPASMIALAVAALPAGAAADGALALLGVAMTWMAAPLDWLSAVPAASWPLLRPPPGAVSAVSWALPVATAAVIGPWGGRWGPWTRLGGCLLAAACLASPLIPPPRAPPGSVEAIFLDVGHGDATLLRFDDGSTMLIDAGGEIGDDGRVGARAVVPALDALDVRRIDVMVVSHPHPDHQNGLLAVARRFPVGEFWCNGQPAAGSEHRALRATLAAQGTRLRVFVSAAPRRWGMGSATIEVLWPSPDRAPWDPNLGMNDNSLVLLVRAGAAQLLLSGDVEAPAEAAMLRQGIVPAGVDVLKVPHHGSRTSSTAAWLTRLEPGLAIAGARAWGALPFPDREIWERYAAMGVPLWQTGDGAVAVQLGPEVVRAARGTAAWLRPARRHAISQTSTQKSEIMAPSAKPGGR